MFNNEHWQIRTPDVNDATSFNKLQSHPQPQSRPIARLLCPNKLTKFYKGVTSYEDKCTAP